MTKSREEKNDLEFLVVMVGSLETMTKRNSQSFFNNIGHMTWRKGDIDHDVMSFWSFRIYH